MTKASNPTHRLHALDAIRAFALLLGIVLHATMSFQTGLADEGWPIVDNSPSTTLDITFFTIHVFRMSTFFFIAGFFAHLSFHRHGTRAFIADRSKRILLPLLIFWPLCIVPISAAMIWAVYKLNGGALPAEAPPAVEGAFPLTHLWFLYELLYLYIITLVMRAAIVALDRNQNLRLAVDYIVARVIRSYFASVIVAIPVVLSLYSIENWVPWGGIPTPDQSLTPIASSLFIFCYVFVLGWLFDRQRDLLQVLKNNCLANTAIAVAAILLCLAKNGFQSDFGSVAEGADKLIFASSYGVAVIASSFAFIGVGMAFFSKENFVIRYLADASYWMYLMHMTFVMLLQTWLMDVGVHWSIKFLLINVLTFIPLLLTYSWFVRSSWIGKMLNGKRLPRRTLLPRASVQTEPV